MQHFRHVVPTALLVFCCASGASAAPPAASSPPSKGLGTLFYAGVGAGAALFGNVNERLGPLGYEDMSHIAVRPEFGLRIEPRTGPALSLSYDMWFFDKSDNRAADTDIHVKLEHWLLRFELPVRDGGWRLYPGLGLGFGRALVRREGFTFDSFEEVANGTDGTAAISSYEVLLAGGATGGYLVQLGTPAAGWQNGVFFGLHAGVVSALSNSWRDGHKPAGVLLPIYYLADHENTLFEEDELRDVLRVGPVRPYLGLVVGVGSSPAGQ